MTPLDTIIQEASDLSEQQLRETVAIAKGMDAANQLNQNREEH